MIDDAWASIGRDSKRAWELPGPLTLSFLPYAKDLREQAAAAHGKVQELMLHLPMEPMGRADPGPGALLVSLSDAELKQRVTTALDSFDGYVGVNNHMGEARFTANKANGMETVLKLFRSARGLMFLDFSRTTVQTVERADRCRKLGVPTMLRATSSSTTTIGRLTPCAASFAGDRGDRPAPGLVVAIGHPHEATLQALAEWLPGLSAKGPRPLRRRQLCCCKRNGWD